MDKLAWSRSLKPSWCLSCRKVKRLLKPQFWLHLFTLLHSGACCLLLTEERVAQRARAGGFCHQIQVSLQICLFSWPSHFTLCPPKMHRRAVSPLSSGSGWICANSLRKGWIFQDAVSCRQGQLSGARAAEMLPAGDWSEWPCYAAIVWRRNMKYFSEKRGAGLLLAWDHQLLRVGNTSALG